MPQNWFNNLMGSATQVSNTASGGIGSALSNVFGGIVGGVTAGVTGGSGIAGGTLQGGGAGTVINQVAGGSNGESAATNILNTNAVQSFAGHSSVNFGGGSALNSALSGGASASTQNDPNSFFGQIPKTNIDGSVITDPSGKPVYSGFWSYWNKPKNWRFYVIWIGGVLFIVVVLAMFGVFSSPKKRKLKKRSGGAIR